MLGACRTPYDDWEQLLRLARDLSDPAGLWVRGHDAAIAAYCHHVGTAHQVVEFGASELPWIVRTLGYTRALAAVSGLSETTRAKVAMHDYTACLPPERSWIWLTVMVHEWAIRSPVGGPVVMAEQLDHLVQLSLRPDCEVQVVPADAGAAAARGSFGFVQWESNQYRPAVLRIDPTGLAGLDDPRTVAVYRRGLDEIKPVAWDLGTSRNFLIEVAEEWRTSTTMAEPA